MMRICITNFLELKNLKKSFQKFHLLLTLS